MIRQKAEESMITKNIAEEVRTVSESVAVIKAKLIAMKFDNPDCEYARLQAMEGLSAIITTIFMTEIAFSALSEQDSKVKS